MQDLKMSAVQSVADSPLTTKAVMVLGAGSVADLGWYEYLPMFFSLTGSAIAGLAGFWLFMRHRQQYKVAKLNEIKVRLEIDELRLRADSA